MEMENNASLLSLRELELGETTRLRLIVYHVRTWLRDMLIGDDTLDFDRPTARPIKKTRMVYRRVDKFMAQQFPGLISTTPRSVAIKMVREKIIELNYSIVEEDTTKPWGAYFRMADEEAERFIGEFFPNLTMEEAKLGRENVELSPKFLLVIPGQRLSWQYHDRRAERWRFLNDGQYFRSHSDELPHTATQAAAGNVVQFDAGERHRLCSNIDNISFTLVAEIWQHTDEQAHSDEADIVRLQDDYKR